MNLRDRAGDRVSGYSLGMKQRLGIAGALLSDPQLLLLDEPANGLDPAGIAGMRDTLRALAAAGKTVFVSSHILSEVQQLADVVGIIARGRLVREGRDRGAAPRGGLRAGAGAPGRGARRPARRSRPLAGPGTVRAETGPEAGWLDVRIDPDRAAELNRALAAAGVFASRIEAGTTLEALFLELTGSSPDVGRPGRRRRSRAAAGGPGVAVVRLLRANLRKLRRRPATWVTFAAPRRAPRARHASSSSWAARRPRTRRRPSRRASS